MANLFTDSFNRADNTSLGANWTEDNGDSAIATNQLSVPTPDGTGASRVATTTTTAHAAVADMAVTATSQTGAGHDGGPVARRTGSGTFYALDVYLNGAQWVAEIYRHAGTFLSGTLIATANVSAHVAGTIYKLEAQGTALRAYRNGTLTTSGTDSNITAAGQAGVYNWRVGGALFDDFSVDDFASATAADTPFQPARIPNRNVGPQVMRLGKRSPVPVDLTQAPVTDTNFGGWIRVPNNRVGPPVLRALYRSPTPFDASVLAPVTDTNFAAPARMPNNRVGPPVLRQQYRPPIYPFDSTRGAAASGNRIRRLICSSSDA